MLTLSPSITPPDTIGSTIWKASAYNLLNTEDLQSLQKKALNLGRFYSQSPQSAYGRSSIDKYTTFTVASTDTPESGQVYYFPFSRERNALLQGLDNLRDLPSDWNGPSSVPLSQFCYMAAYQFAREADKWAQSSQKTIPKVHVAPMPSGGVLMQWFGKETNGRELIVTFKPKNKLKCRVYAVDDAKGFELEQDFLYFWEVEHILGWLIG